MSRSGVIAVSVLAALAGCASSPTGFVVQDVDRFVAGDERMQIFNENASRVTMIGHSTLASRAWMLGPEKREDVRRYYFENPRVTGLLEVTARKRRDGWEIVDMEVDYMTYTIQPREWHIELKE